MCGRPSHTKRKCESCTLGVQEQELIQQSSGCLQEPDPRLWRMGMRPTTKITRLILEAKAENFGIHTSRWSGGGFYLVRKFAHKAFYSLQLLPTQGSYDTK